MLTSFKKRIMLKLILFSFCLLNVLTNTSFAQNEEPLKVGYYNSPPFVEVTESGELTGLSVWLWDRITEKNNINYELVEIPLEHKPLNETIDQLKNNEIDISLSPLTITSSRNKELIFSQPYFVSNLTVLEHKSSGFSKWKSFVLSFFSIEFIRTLIVLFSILLLFGFLIWLFERRSQDNDFGKGINGILNGVWWSAVTMTTVGYGDKCPKTWGGKTVALIWMFTAILIISSFTASIASSLTLTSLENNTTSINKLKDKRVGTVYASATEKYLESNFFSDITAYEELSYGLKSLKNREVDYFIYDEPYMQHLINNHPEFKELEFLPLKFNVDLYAFGFKRGFNTELLQKINQSIIEIKEGKQWEFVLNEYNLSEL